MPTSGGGIGSGGSWGLSPAAGAPALNGPWDICFDGSMNAYITNSVGNNILKVAAGGVSYTRFDTTVTMVKPYGCKFDPNGNMWVGGTNLLYRLDGSTGAVTTIVSSLAAQLTGIQIDSFGTLYVSSTTPGVGWVNRYNSNGGVIGPALLATGEKFLSGNIAPTGQMALPVGTGQIMLFGLGQTPCTLTAPANGFLGTCTASYASQTPCTMRCAPAFFLSSIATYCDQGVARGVPVCVATSVGAFPQFDSITSQRVPPTIPLVSCILPRRLPPARCTR